MSKLGRDRSQELIERSSSETLRKDAARGGVVTLASQGAQFVLQLGSTAIMARLLEIEDFGVFAVALTFTMVLARFRDAGLRTANVQAQALTNGQATSLLMINAGIGLVFALAIAALAPAVAAAYSQPELTPVFLILSASFFVGSLGVQFNGILHRRMQLTALASIEVAALAVSIAAGVASALAGAGVLALAVMQLARQVSITLGSIVLARWAPTRPAPMRDVKGMVGFGFSLALSGGVNQLGAGSDRALLGFFNAQATGLYSKAFTLAALPLEKISPAFGRVAMPSLSQLLERPHAYRHAYRRLITSLILLATPVTCVLALEADTVIRIVLGEKWGGAVLLFRLLCVGGLILPLWNSAGWLFVSQGRGKQMLSWHVFDAIVKIVTCAVAVWWGAAALCVAVSLRYVFMMPLLARRVGREGPVSASEMLRPLGMIAMLAGPGIVIAWGARVLATNAWGAPLAGMAGAVYLLVYAATVLLTDGYRDQLVYAAQSLRGRLQKGGTGA